MKVRTKLPITIQKDREGELIGHVEIELTLIKKDDGAKELTFQAVDSIITDLGLETEKRKIITNRDNKQAKKTYTVSYATYDSEKVTFSGLYPKPEGMTELEYDDYLLGKKLLFNLEIDPIYGLVGNDWMIV